MEVKAFGALFKVQLLVWGARANFVSVSSSVCTCSRAPNLQTVLPKAGGRLL